MYRQILVAVDVSNASSKKKRSRLFEQLSPIHKWAQSKLQLMQSGLFGRSTRWA